jgi:hypothetical protein
MWEVRKINDAQEDEFELLRPSDAISTKDSADSDRRSLASVTLRTESYQSTSRLIIFLFCFITALLLILTCATFGSSITSNRKSEFNVQGIMPSVNVGSGNCETLKYANLTLHLIINCLGTIIIGCSNYLQQSMFLLISR